MNEEDAGLLRLRMFLRKAKEHASLRMTMLVGPGKGQSR